MKLSTKKTSALYVPKRCSTSHFCHCGEPKQVTEMKCPFCSDPLRALVCQCVAEGKTRAEKDLLSH